MKKISYKSYLILLLLISISLSIFGTAFINYLIDPLQYFRSRDMVIDSLYPRRYALYNMIKNHKYDYLIMGTSMVNSFDEKFASEKFGGRVLKLNMAGSSSYEQSRVLDFAIRQNPNVKIIWEVTLHVFAYPSKYLPSEDIFPLWLYEDFKIHEVLFKYLVSQDTLKKSFHLLRSDKVKKNEFKYQRAKKYKTYLNEEQGLKYLSQMKKEGKDVHPRDSKNLILSLDESMIEVVRKYPNTKFISFFSPQSEYYFKGMKFIWINAKERIISFKKKLIEFSFERENLEVHDFQCDMTLVKNKKYYADITHHNHLLSNIIVSELVKKTKLARKETYKDRLRDFLKVFD